MRTITQAKALELLETGAEWLGKAEMGNKWYLFLRFSEVGEGDSVVRTEVQG